MREGKRRYEKEDRMGRADTISLYLLAILNCHTERLFLLHMKRKRVVMHSFFMAKHSFIETVAKVFLFALVPSFTIHFFHP